MERMRFGYRLDWRRLSVTQPKDKLSVTDQPQVDQGSASAKAVMLTDVETNRQIGRGEVPHGIAPVPLSGQELNVDTTGLRERIAPFAMGFRDIDAPRSPDHEPNGKPDIYDRLAQKDRVPVTRNGLL